MNEKVLNFLQGNDISVLSIGQPDSSVHSAMMHFASEDGTTIYFLTNGKSKKCAGFLAQNHLPAGIVVGTGENWKTLQMTGMIRRLEDQKEIDESGRVLFERHPTDRSHITPDSVYLLFKTTWFRYSDLSAKPPEYIEPRPSL
jgi:general stress protein 26